jgi:hypothetical protein
MLINNIFRIRANESVRVLLDDNGPTSQVDDIVEDNDNDNQMTIEVLGDMPKVIGFEQETIIQVLIFNFSFINLLLYYYFTYILVKK